MLVVCVYDENVRIIVMLIMKSIRIKINDMRIIYKEGE
jgi:hypothetical protein